MDSKTGAYLELTYYTDIDDNGNALLRGKWDYYGNDTWTWTATRHYRLCLQISKDDGPREKIRWENEDGKWMDVVEVEIKDKAVPKPVIDPKTNKTKEPEPCVDKKDDNKKKLNATETTKVCPGKGGNHTDHADFCSLSDDSPIMNSRSGVTIVKGSG